MKKILILVLSVVLCLATFAGCAGKATKLDNVGGEVVGGNGTFAVQKGDYVYFINGKESVSVDNTFGKVDKASLVRIKTTDLKNPTDAKIETVIPKLMVSENYKSGFYMFGDYVYFATPSTEKNNKGVVKYTETEFYRFNLKTAKTDSKKIAKISTNTQEFKFFEKSGKVYLTFVDTVKEDDKDVKKLFVYDESGKNVYTSNAVSDVMMPEDNNGKIFFTVNPHLESLKKDATYHELYSYEVGATESVLVVNGAGSNYREDNEKVLQQNGFEGVTVSFVKNTGSILFYSVTELDNNQVFYYAYDTENKYLGASADIAEAITANSYVKSLNEIYYVGTGSYAGIVKFNYEEANTLTHGKTVVSYDGASKRIEFVDGEDMYLVDTAEGFYYKCNYLGTDVKVEKINAVAMQTATDWYLPRVIGGCFVGTYSNEIFGKYVYSIDLSKIGEDYLKEYETLDREVSLKIMNSGLLNGNAKKAVQEKIDSTYPEDKE